MRLRLWRKRQTRACRPVFHECHKMIPQAIVHCHNLLPGDSLLQRLTNPPFLRVYGYIRLYNSGGPDCDRWSHACRRTLEKEIRAMTIAAARIFLIAVVLSTQAVSGADTARQLISNPTFVQNENKDFPAHWSIWNAVLEQAICKARAVDEGLLIESASSPFAVGGVTQKIENIKPGQAYAIEATCKFDNIPTPYQSAQVRLTWTNKGRPVHPAGVLVRGPVLKNNEGSFSDVLVAPQSTDGAVISLEVKWPQGGSVVWREVSMRPVEAPKPRKVKIGTVFLRPRNSTPEKNLKLFCDQIDEAGRLGLDIVCLGEAITSVGTSSTIKDCAQPIPGLVTTILAAAAKRNNIWVVAGLTELDGDVVYNTAVLLNRKGQLAGKYRKVHLPREEWRKGITPGHSYPVFETDFGTIAIQICYDWFFPEAGEIFALKGAEIIFAPTWGDTLADQDGRVNGETVFRVRARDNGVYMVPSVYDGSSMVIDPMGRILASNKGKQGVFWAEVDLNKREPLPWVGHWRSIGPRHRMQGTYQYLLENSKGPTY